MGIFVYEDKADEFVEHLRTLPDDDAVALAKTALREANREHNTRVLFRSKAFTTWMLDMHKKGLISG